MRTEQAAHGQLVHPTAGSYARQPPETHSSPRVQTLPHAPQWNGSVLAETHPKPPPIGHFVCPGGHAVAPGLHAPEMQTRPELHVPQQAPQCSQLPLSVTHGPSQ